MSNVTSLSLNIPIPLYEKLTEISEDYGVDLNCSLIQLLEIYAFTYQQMKRGK